MGKVKSVKDYGKCLTKLLSGLIQGFDIDGRRLKSLDIDKSFVYNNYL